MAEDGSKRWGEAFFLLYTPFWLTLCLGVVVPFKLYEVCLLLLRCVHLDPHDSRLVRPSGSRLDLGRCGHDHDEIRMRCCSGSGSEWVNKLLLIRTLLSFCPFLASCAMCRGSRSWST